MADADAQADGHLGAAGLLVEQLWAPILASGLIRIHTGASEPGWVDLERYLALPSVRKATMLLPAGGRQALAGSLLNFRRLRPPVTRLQRTVLGRAAAAGVALPFPTLRLQARAENIERPMLPTEQIARQLDAGQLHAAIGVRTGGNRKATLQLVHGDGTPAGFAKFSWESLSAGGVKREAAALTAIGGGAKLTGSPRVLAQGSWHGWPYLVTEPLPDGSGRLRRDDLPSPQEIFALCPITRTDRVKATQHFHGLRNRMVAWTERGNERHLTASITALLDRTAAIEVPVAARWHGDLTPWNSGRDEQGKLWCWDWESSEPDVTAGLDAVHWAATARTQRGERYSGRLLDTAIAEASQVLVAAGHSPRSQSVVPTLYVASIVERAIDLAAGNGYWAEGWLSRDEAVELLEFAHSTLPP